MKTENNNSPEEGYRRPWRDPEVLESLYWQEGLTLKEVGEKLGVGTDTVRGQMVNHDIPRRSRGSGMDADPERLHHLRVDKGLTLREIADEIGVSHMAVKYRLEKYNIGDYADNEKAERDSLIENQLIEQDYPHIKEKHRHLYENAVERKVAFEIDGSKKLSEEEADYIVETFEAILTDVLNDDRSVMMHVECHSTPRVKDKHFELADT